jgi:hypothetical protein
MSPDARAILLAISCACFASNLVAAPDLLSLRNNPFSRPEIVNAPPPPPPVAPIVVLPPEEVVLDLTATMVSKTVPMVIVDGELLAIGDEIEGLKLIEVMEGRAVFARAGKKYSFMIADDRPK